MPCDQIITILSDFSKADLTLVAEAIQELGLSGRVRFENGKLESTSAEDIASVKTSYVIKVIRKVAARKGWSLKQDGKKWAMSRR